MDNVDEFIDLIIKEKNLNLDEEKTKNLHQFLLNKLLDRIDEAMLNELDEDDAIELQNMSLDERFSAEVSDDYLREHGVNVERVALATMLQFREDVLKTEVKPEFVKKEEGDGE